MRLTPSWFRSSSDTSTEHSGETESTAEVAIYYTSVASSTGEGEPDDRRVTEFVPESDAELLALIDEMNTPVTVDEIADQLTEPARPSIETWAGVHERLHQNRLPTLDAAGDIEFDDTQGLVDRPTAYPVEGELRSTAAVGSISIAALFVLIALVSASALTALAVTLITTTFAVWFVPSFV